MKRRRPHIHPEHGLFDGGRRGDHLFIHHGSELLYPHVLPLRTQLLNTSEMQIAVLSGLVGIPGPSAPHLSQSVDALDGVAHRRRVCPRETVLKLQVLQELKEAVGAVAAAVD